MGAGGMEVGGTTMADTMGAITMAVTVTIGVSIQAMDMAWAD